MDIERFRQILEELNPIFWNAKIDRLLHKSGFPKHTDIESAQGRYVIALRDLYPNHDLSAFPKSASHRRMILDDKNPQKKRRDKLLKDARKCLNPPHEAYDILREEFTSSFAKQVLVNHKKVIGDFVGTDAFGRWTELIVCMSHKDFWGNLNNDKAGDTNKHQEEGEQGSLKSKYVFRRNGDYWEIVYGGDALGNIEPSRGIGYIHYLIEHKGDVIRCVDLEEAFAENTADKNDEEVSSIKEARKQVDFNLTHRA